MNQIAIQDANILIDLLAIGMFNHCLAAPCQFITTDIILAELYEHQVDLIQPYIHSGRFSVIAITAEELLEIQSLSLEDERLSIQDWSAFFYADKLGALLMTGDKRLRTMAEAKGVKVCGTLRLFDDLVSNGIISEEQACSFLQHLLRVNRRLPANECNSRMAKWCLPFLPYANHR
jgi:predicted nucleic acid-binding protein